MIEPVKWVLCLKKNSFIKEFDIEKNLLVIIYQYLSYQNLNVENLISHYLDFSFVR